MRVTLGHEYKSPLSVTELTDFIGNNNNNNTNICKAHIVSIRAESEAPVTSFSECSTWTHARGIEFYCV